MRFSTGATGCVSTLSPRRSDSLRLMAGLLRAAVRLDGCQLTDGRPKHFHELWRFQHHPLPYRKCVLLMTVWSQLKQAVLAALRLRSHPDCRSEARFTPFAYAAATGPLVADRALRLAFRISHTYSAALSRPPAALRYVRSIATQTRGRRGD